MTTLTEWRAARRIGQEAGSAVPSQEQRDREAAAADADVSGKDEGEPPDLTEAELAAAARTGMSPERYAALRGTTSLDEWKAARSTKVEVELTQEQADELRRTGRLDTEIKV
jgi:hypothetical protein